MDDIAVAYFSMEIGLAAEMPTYSGGLGVLAADTVRAAADLGVPFAAVTLLHRKGYFRQHLDEGGNQSETPCEWVPERFLEPLEPRASVCIEGRRVLLRAWRYRVRGIRGHHAPVYFLDTALPDNEPGDQGLSDYLYGGDEHYRICQEAVLGLGGVAMLEALGHTNVRTYHMNEGHSSLLALALLEQAMRAHGDANPNRAHVEQVRHRCLFTTHTPVPAGNDQFPLALVDRVLGGAAASTLQQLGCMLDGTLNMTYLGLYFARYVNGVSLRHEQIAQHMYPQYRVSAVTDGVHADTWTAPPMRELYNRHIPSWRRDNHYLRYAIGIPLAEIKEAHSQAKRTLIETVNGEFAMRFDPAVFTIGFARRATAYKRADLLFTDTARLRRIATETGALQILFAGKAHPRDWGGKEIIRRVFAAAAALRPDVRIAYLEEYDIELAKLLCAGVDLWLNTPQAPQEASGTSGMKAALNGVPSLSVLDGWWIEGHVEGVTGWSIGEPWSEPAGAPAGEAAALYAKLETVILPLFYTRPDAYAAVRRHAIALNGSFFNAQRMVEQYLENAYALGRASFT